MSKVMAIGAMAAGHDTGIWGVVHAAGTKVSLAAVYAMMGMAGLLLWLVVHMPIGARARETTAYAMAGCVGMFTLGWEMVRAQRSGRAHS